MTAATATPQIDILLRLVPDHPDTVLTHLTQHPSLASASDVSGYSLLHAAASYNQLAFLRTLTSAPYHVSINILDSEGETPLFAAETLDVARCLVEELGADTTIRNGEGLSAAENAQTCIEDGAEWALVADYLSSREGMVITEGSNSFTNLNGGHAPPPLPPNVRINVGTVMPEELGEEGAPDPEFRRRIEELAARDDFQTAEGQAELRRLVTEAVGGLASDTNERDVRRRLD